MLTLKQRAAIPKILQAELSGEGISNLLKGKERIAARSTYYSKWLIDPEFVAALNAARLKVMDGVIDAAIRQAAAKLAVATPLAAEALIASLTDNQRRIQAANSILDRASKLTASKGAQLVAITADDLAAAEEELDTWNRNHPLSSG